MVNFALFAVCAGNSFPNPRRNLKRIKEAFSASEYTFYTLNY